MLPNQKLPADTLISCFNESSADCVKVVDVDARILSFSKHGYEIMEIDNPQDVIGKDWLSFWQGEMAPKAEAAFEKAKNGELGFFEGFCPTFKGTPKWWQVTVVPLKNDRNDISWLLAMSRDVTELYDLRAENAKLRKTTVAAT